MDAPEALRPYLGEHTPDRLSHLGNAGLLKLPLLAVLCSQQCPASLILQAYDLAGKLAQAGVAVIAGFHSPVEQEMLAVLLRGRQPVVVCPARGLEGMRLPAAWKTPLEQERLLLLSPFPAGLRRPTAETAAARNRLAGALARAIFVVHASPGGRLEKQCGEFISQGKPVLAFDHADNRRLLQMGATGIRDLAQLGPFLHPSLPPDWV